LNGHLGEASLRSLVERFQAVMFSSLS